MPECPFVLLAQQSLFDPTRAPAGKHTTWAYCHAPMGCDTDLAPLIQAQIERFAPGFGALVLARSVKLYLCSSFTPPGGGVHGMCGFHAAQAALAGELR